ncbi:MAG: methyltransferase domain-containing protein [Bacteroidales bacterium]|nr:methyltransferase domain-containing protein [Bacteroidales bacterium]
MNLTNLQLAHSNAKKIAVRKKDSRIPHSLVKNQKEINVSQRKKIKLSVSEHYNQVWAEKTGNTVETEINYFVSDIIGRLNTSRIQYIPWLNETIKLNGCNILEIGCGTGSSLVTLAEQGATVTGIDIDERSIKVAKDVCEIFNVPSTIISGNACEVYDAIKNHKFDLIVFIASLEHMLYSERIDCLKKYYGLLAHDAYFGILETPNRLWYFDDHTSALPFFHWLPDHVAFDYLKFHNDRAFKRSYSENTEDEFLKFLRRGRGFSYHELEIALQIPAEKLNIISYLSPVLPGPSDKKFQILLMQTNPGISKGFFYPYIDLLIKKSSKI